LFEKKIFFNFFGSQLVIKVKTGCTVHSTQVISTIQIKDLLFYTHEKLGCSTGIKFEGLLTIIGHNISQTPSRIKFDNILVWLWLSNITLVKLNQGGDYVWLIFCSTNVMFD